MISGTSLMLINLIMMIKIAAYRIAGGMLQSGLSDASHRVDEGGRESWYWMTLSWYCLSSDESVQGQEPC